MAEASTDSQLENYFTRLDVQLKKSQFKKALKLVDESKPPYHHIAILYVFTSQIANTPPSRFYDVFWCSSCYQSWR